MQTGPVRAVLALVVLAALVVAGAGVGAGVGGHGDAAATGDAALAGPGEGAFPQADGAVFAQDEVDADRVALRANVTETGDAAWRIEYRVRLDSDEREQAFADLERDVAENTSDYRDRFRQRMERTVSTAANATGREMAVEDVRVSTDRASLPQGEYGLLVYEFRWTGFAVVEDDRILVGDALAGYFLEEGHSLRIEWPAGYELQSATPSPDETGETAVTWRGPVDFGGDEPRVTVAEASGLPITGLGVAGVLALVVAGALLVRRRDRLRAVLAGGGATDATDDDGPDAAGDAGVAESGASGGAADDAAAESGDEPPEELLSNEERVLKLLRENGGRMKQQDVVEALGWTEARTSQVVTDLREEGDLESFRLGRENVLRLPEEDDEELP